MLAWAFWYNGFVKKSLHYSAALKAYLKRLENPYASLQICDDVEKTEIEVHNDEQHSYRLLQNPYAKLSMAGEAEEAEEASSKPIPMSPVASTRGSLSKAEFRVRSRRIFEQYIPALEKGRLRAHHRDFITRNQSCSPPKRYRLVKELEKYDLAKVHGLKAHFNREREALTSEKLKQIERLVESED